MCKNSGVNAVLAEHWSNGGEGAAKLAETVVSTIEATPSNLKFYMMIKTTKRKKLIKFVMKFTELKK